MAAGSTTVLAIAAFYEIRASRKERQTEVAEIMAENVYVPLAKDIGKASMRSGLRSSVSFYGWRELQVERPHLANVMPASLRKRLDKFQQGFDRMHEISTRMNARIGDHMSHFAKAALGVDEPRKAPVEIRVLGRSSVLENVRILDMWLNDGSLETVAEKAAASHNEEGWTLEVTVDGRTHPRLHDPHELWHHVEGRLKADSDANELRVIARTLRQEAVTLEKAIHEELENFGKLVR